MPGDHEQLRVEARLPTGGQERGVPALVDVLRVGRLGVDLFFMLSGFVLAHNYLSRLGPEPGLAATGHFLWARIARIWPLYVVALLLGGVALLLRQVLFGSDPTVPLTFGKLAEQVLMVQQWTDPDVAYTSWTTPGWSISAEWLAYLSFPILAVFVWRLQRYVGPRLLAGLSILTLLPLLVWMADAESQGEPWMWIGRLASEFVCGMLVAAALPTTPSTRSASSSAPSSPPSASSATSATSPRSCAKTSAASTHSSSRPTTTRPCSTPT